MHDLRRKGESKHDPNLETLQDMMSRHPFVLGTKPQTQIIESCDLISISKAIGKDVSPTNV